MCCFFNKNKRLREENEYLKMRNEKDQFNFFVLGFFSALAILKLILIIVNAKSENCPLKNFYNNTKNNLTDFKQNTCETKNNALNNAKKFFDKYKIGKSKFIINIDDSQSFNDDITENNEEFFEE